MPTFICDDESASRAGPVSPVRASIQTAAREELRRHGPGGVSLRAAARRAGLAPSSVYRYFRDRAELLMALRIDAYDGVMARLAAARDAAPANDYLEQWMSMAHALRNWAQDAPDEFALLYTSPEGANTTALEQRAAAMSLVGTVVHHAIEADQLVPATDGRTVEHYGSSIPGPDGPLSAVVIQLTMGGWAALVGHIVLEPRRTGLVLDADRHFEEYLTAVAQGLGFRLETDENKPRGQ